MQNRCFHNTHHRLGERLAQRTDGRVGAETGQHEAIILLCDRQDFVERPIRTDDFIKDPLNRFRSMIRAKGIDRHPGARRGLGGAPNGFSHGLACIGVDHE